MHDSTLLARACTALPHIHLIALCNTMLHDDLVRLSSVQP